MSVIGTSVYFVIKRVLGDGYNVAPLLRCQVADSLNYLLQPLHSLISSLACILINAN